MAERLWTFIRQAAPIDGQHWLAQALEHTSDLEAQVVADLLGQMAYVAMTSVGDMRRGYELARRSLDAAARSAVSESAWAWLAETAYGLGHSEVTDPLAAGEQALSTGLARGDDIAVVSALAIMGLRHHSLGNTAQSSRNFDEAIAIAERTGRPASIQAAVVAAASAYLQTTHPDYQASIDRLRRYKATEQIADMTTMMLEANWGAAYTGLGDPKACAHLALAFRLADLIGALHIQDFALRLLALLAAETGHVEEAARLVGYTDARFREHRQWADYPWADKRLEAALAGAPTRTYDEAAGAVSSRREILDLVSRLRELFGHE